MAINKTIKLIIVKDHWKDIVDSNTDARIGPIIDPNAKAPVLIALILFLI